MAVSDIFDAAHDLKRDAEDLLRRFTRIQMALVMNARVRAPTIREHGDGCDIPEEAASRQRSSRLPPRGGHLECVLQLSGECSGPDRTAPSN